MLKTTLAQMPDASVRRLISVAELACRFLFLAALANHTRSRPNSILRFQLPGHQIRDGLADVFAFVEHGAGFVNDGRFE